MELKLSRFQVALSKVQVDFGSMVETQWTDIQYGFWQENYQQEAAAQSKVSYASVIQSLSAGVSLFSYMPSLMSNVNVQCCSAQTDPTYLSSDLKKRTFYLQNCGYG